MVYKYDTVIEKDGYIYICIYERSGKQWLELKRWPIKFESLKLKCYEDNMKECAASVIHLREQGHTVI